MSLIDDLLAALDDGDPLTTDETLTRLRRALELNDVDGAKSLRVARALTVHGTYNDLPRACNLALAAHHDHQPGAGVLAAECFDRIELLSGRAQRFGTATTEHQGDVVMAPVDPTTSDAARAELGLPSLDELRRAVDSRNRERAAERADREPAPIGPGSGARPHNTPFYRIWRSPSADDLQARWDAVGSPAWADGDELTLVCRRDEPGVFVYPVFQMPMWRVDDSDLFALTLHVDRLDEALFGYMFWSMGTDGQPRGARPSEPDGRFRGPAAPPEAPSNRALRGSLSEHAVESAALGEPRRVVVYTPPGHSRADGMPVVYATDGNMFAPYARRIDAAIETGAIPPVVVVAAHSAPADHRGNIRALEYLIGFDDQRFDAHQRFFVDELAAWAEAELGVSRDRSQRAVFGCSDGGGHALVTGRLHADRYGHVIGFSAGTPPDERSRWDPATAPMVHLCAGTLEVPFHQATEAWAAWLHLHGVAHDWTERVCGHDLIQWCEELPRAIARAWA